MTVGFTYDTNEHKYYLITIGFVDGLCLACTKPLNPEIENFCFECKTPRPLDWTTGNNSLDSFIMESWRNTKSSLFHTYIQWIEFSQLANIRAETSLHHEGTHMADWLKPSRNEFMQVILKKIVDGHNAQLFNFYQVSRYFVDSVACVYSTICNTYYFLPSIVNQRLS
jgi:hypothetical protein